VIYRITLRFFSLLYAMNAEEIMMNGNGHSNGTTIHLIGDDHVATAYDTPMREDAFELSDEEKMNKITANFREIMDTLGLDLTDDSLNGTPRRVAKMFVKEIFKGLTPKINPPRRFSTINTAINRCLSKNLSRYNRLANTTFCRFTAKRISLIFRAEK